MKLFAALLLCVSGLALSGAASAGGSDVLSFSPSLLLFAAGLAGVAMLRPGR